MGATPCTCHCTRATPEDPTDAPEDSSPASVHVPLDIGPGNMEEVKVDLNGNSRGLPAVARLAVVRSDSCGQDAEAPEGAGCAAAAAGPEVDGVVWQPAKVNSPVAQATFPGSAGAGRRSRDTVDAFYEGTYLGTEKHGVGTLRTKSCTYTGDFWHDIKHGNATLEWDDGRRYSGQFRQGKFHGSAEMIWPDGRRYNGQYAEDQKHGHGTFTWRDGRCYEGQWVRGTRHGTGTYTNAKGLTCQGYWHHDRPMGWEMEPPPVGTGTCA